MKVIRCIIIVLLFLLIFIAVYCIHARFFKVGVVFYASIFDAILSVIIVGLILYSFSIFSIFCKFEKIQILIMLILLGYCFSISIPTVIDRSLSFYILEKIQQRGGGIKMNKFDYVFTNEYLKEHRLVDVRLTEQLESGTIVLHDGCVRLTSKGEYIATFGRFFRKNLLPKKRLLMGEYTDDLTDPFRHSVEAPDYICQ